MIKVTFQAESGNVYWTVCERFSLYSDGAYLLNPDWQDRIEVVALPLHALLVEVAAMSRREDDHPFHAEGQEAQRALADH